MVDLLALLLSDVFTRMLVMLENALWYRAYQVTPYTAPSGNCIHDCEAREPPAGPGLGTPLDFQRCKIEFNQFGCDLHCCWKR